MISHPCPTPQDIRLAFLSTQQAIRMLMELPQDVLDDLRFYDVDDQACREPFPIDSALAELQRDVWELVQSREKWKAEQKRLGVIELI